MNDIERKAHVLALKKIFVVMMTLAKQLGENDPIAEHETKILGRSLVWAIEQLEGKCQPK